MSHHGRSTSKPITPQGVRGKKRSASITASETDFTEESARTQATRPVKAGTGKHRGDRRDMHKTYTTTTRHAARGNTPRPNVATRAN
jgi:hypothetical protein